MAKTDKAVAVKETEEQENGVLEADSKKQVQSVEFAEATDYKSAGVGGSIDILLDMDVPITVAIGKTQIPVRRLLQLGPGSVLKLGKNIDEPVELYLQDNKFATGTVVVVDDHFAVKIKQILSPGDSGDKVTKMEKKQ